MTTTPTASPALPDLARLEALACAADQGEGQHIYTNPRDSDGWQANETWHHAASPAAVLALIAIARRAKPYATGGMVPGGLHLAGEGSQPLHTLPEGEAPQAKDTPESMAQSNARFAIDGAIQYGRENRNEPPSTEHWLYEYWNIGRQLAQLGATGWDNVTPAPAATLSPLCGAQHAESGKESVRQHEAIEVAVDQCYPKQDSPHASVNDKIGAARLAFRKGYRAALAAQQAAAPGALDADEMTRLRRLMRAIGWDHERDESDKIVRGTLFAVLGRAADKLESAPGTPEAPDEDRKGIELWRATLRACGELPEGYEVCIELENGCGMAVWYDAEGERHVIDGDGYLSSDVNEAVDAAIERAAQLDGGQEGSGS